MPRKARITETPFLSFGKWSFYARHPLTVLLEVLALVAMVPIFLAGILFFAVFIVLVALIQVPVLFVAWLLGDVKKEERLVKKRKTRSKKAKP